jgi:hypothetical protein
MAASYANIPQARGELESIALACLYFEAEKKE